MCCDTCSNLCRLGDSTNPTPIFPHPKIYQSAGVESSDPSKSEQLKNERVTQSHQLAQAHASPVLGRNGTMTSGNAAMPKFSYQFWMLPIPSKVPRSLFTVQRLMNFMCHFPKNCYPFRMSRERLVSSVPAAGFIPAPTEPRINGTVVSVNENQHRIRRRRQKGRSGCGVGVPSVPCL